MKIAKALLLACLALSSTVAMADERAEAAEAAAERLLEAMDMRTAMDSIIDVSLDNEIASKPELAPFKGVMRDFFSRYMSYPALKPRLMAVYASEFTAAELDEAAAFYSTPTGRKLLSRLPALMKKGGEIGTQAIQDHLPELRESIENEAARLQGLQQADGQPGDMQ